MTALEKKIYKRFLKREKRNIFIEKNNTKATCKKCKNKITIQLTIIIVKQAAMSLMVQVTRPKFGQYSR